MDNNNQDTSELGQAIQDVTEQMSLLVREEIELAKTEVTQKVTKLIKGAVVGIVAGIFAVFGLVYLLHALAWLLWDLLGNTHNFWLGFLIVAAALFVLGGLAGLIAARLVKRAAPPTPQMAIEEGKLIKETVTSAHPSEVQGPREVAVTREEVRS
jgi:uncharacterized membrane protein YqjE